MKTRCWLFLLLSVMLMAVTLSGCGSDRAISPTEVDLDATAAEDIAGERATARAGGSMELSPDKLYLAIIWHQHQPVYFKDPDSGAYERPWVRVHAAKDYVDMAAILEAYPGIRATYNLTPSLIRQLEDLSAGAKDLYWLHTEIPAADLSLEEKQFIVDRFFDINPSIIARFPRYQELADMRDKPVDQWSGQELLDLQVLFNLAWTDPAWLAEAPLADLVQRGESFEETDKAIVLSEHQRLIERVIPLHAELQQQGRIEVTMTPFAHPILPLLIDSDLARPGMPEADLPTRFVYGQDAVAQVELGVDLYREHFGQAPRGMWPAEGSVAEEMISMVANAGIQWMATDEDVLAHSLASVEDFTRDSHDVVQQADELYQPYAVEGARGGPVAIIFRDHLISDKVGFEYSGMDGEEAAADFLGRLEDIRQRLIEEGAAGPHLVTVLLDGENAWEYYPGDGKEFLHAMYQGLSESETLVTVTPSEYLQALEAQDHELPQIKQLWPGSWIDGTFSTWIGEEEENQAWEYLRRTREDVQEASGSLDDETLDQVLETMYIAEGSDWFWWYGADQNSGVDENFDRQFRSYLEQAYILMEEEVPSFVHVPVIPQAQQQPDREPKGLLAVDADGRISGQEWEQAGYYQIAEAGLESLYYGFDQETLFLRVDAAADFEDGMALGFYLLTPGAGPSNAYSRYGQGETLLGFGVKRLIEVSFQEGAANATIYQADGSEGWTELDVELEGVVSQAGLLEIAVPLEAFAAEARSGNRLNMRLVVSQGEEDVAVLPAEGPAVAVVPDLPIPNVFIQVSDPSGDDYGPGSYDYPADAVFKPGAFDLTQFTAGYDDQDYIFRAQFRGPVINEWGSPNGLSLQTVDVYLDVDGPETGARLLLPGRNAALSADYAWDYAIWAEGWTPGVYKPSPEGPVQVDGGLTIVTNPGQRRVTIRVPRSLLPDDPSSWRIAAVVLSQEGFPAAGVWRVRDVQPEVEQWRIGGGTGSVLDTRILDLLWPEGAPGSQEDMLRNPFVSGEEPAEAGADDYAQIPMLEPGIGSEE
ncbi:MAG: glucodextranase DOMON-like domain-containing protein [Anaerolineales bacterium]